MEFSTINSEIVGWRLDLVCHHLLWKGSQFLAAKAEFFALLAKTLSVSPPVTVRIYTDIWTYDRHYRKWLEEEGITKPFANDGLSFLIVRGESFDSPQALKKLEEILSEEQASDFFQEIMKKDYFDSFLVNVNSAMSEQIDTQTELYPDKPPEWLDMHQQSMDDSILAIWEEKPE